METSARRTKGEVSPVAGVKRPAPVPSLLPAFEPYSSSPPLPRPAKRVARASPSPKCSPTKSFQQAKHRKTVRTQYPTPVPTSSTGIISSSPPQLPYTRRAPLQRTISALSERAPLASVPTVELDAGGEETLMGRSGKTSNYQLSTNKLISRVHVRAAYVPGKPPHPSKVELVCTGWNGVKIHCQGKAWELGKDDTFTSESQGADIMVDVQDARVLLQWPKAAKKVTTPSDTDSNPESENSPSRNATGTVRRATFQSPLRQRARLQSPVSPSPAVADAFGGFFGLSTSAPAVVQIYEDAASPSEEHGEGNLIAEPTQSTQRLSQPLGTNVHLPQSGEEEEFSDQDEENEPIVHSFGTSGANLLSRMASIDAGSGKHAHSPVPAEVEMLAPVERSNSEFLRDETAKSIVNHVVNQLAFSRLSSTPLSTIMGHLPSELRSASSEHIEDQKLSLSTLKHLIDHTKCIGEVTREGKDAAGKKLESEYYYIPDSDFDEGRRDAVVDGLKKPGLRGCRKQHKQYYWRKPK